MSTTTTHPTTPTSKTLLLSTPNRKKDNQEQQDLSTMPSSSNNDIIVTVWNVYLFIPNLIGYARILCTLSSFYFMILYLNIGLTTTTNDNNNNNLWITGIVLYTCSFVGDLFDGWAARKFSQTSQWGSVLDMMTDRCATLGLLYILGLQEQQRVILGDNTTTTTKLFYCLFYLMLIVLDISSHWCQMYSTTTNQSSNIHHKSKECNANRNILVQWYYQYYALFGYCCVGAEFYYICLYILYNIDNNENGNAILFLAVNILKWICLPGWFFKQIVNACQLASASRVIAQEDAIRHTQQQQDVIAAPQSQAIPMSPSHQYTNGKHH